jgi:hypothetical protein
MIQNVPEPWHTAMQSASLMVGNYAAALKTKMTHLTEEEPMWKLTKLTSYTL